MNPLRPSLRLRLTLVYTVLFVLSGAALLAVTWALLAALPVGVEHHGALRAGGSPLPQLPSPAAEASAQRSDDLRSLLARAALGLGITTVLAGGVGWVVAGRILRPLQTITATTRRISASNLHERLDLAGPRDELTDLADTVDGLLTRLERAFVAQRRFVANAAHELRTPLTVQRAHLESVLSDPHASADSWRTACERALAAGEHEQRIIDALLTLARSDAGVDRRERCDLSHLAIRAVAQSRDLAARRGLTWHTSLRSVQVEGDPRLLESLIGNLVTNAVRHNVEGGSLSVQTGTETSTETSQPRVIVASSGELLAAGEVPSLFQPFQRRSGRSDTDGGVGLGLSLVQAIADAHGAAVMAEPLPTGGLSVTVIFPRPPAPDRP